MVQTCLPNGRPTWGAPAHESAQTLARGWRTGLDSLLHWKRKPRRSRNSCRSPLAPAATRPRKPRTTLCRYSVRRGKLVGADEAGTAAPRTVRPGTWWDTELGQNFVIWDFVERRIAIPAMPRVAGNDAWPTLRVATKSSRRHPSGHQYWALLEPSRGAAHNSRRV